MEVRLVLHSKFHWQNFNINLLGNYSRKVTGGIGHKNIIHKNISYVEYICHIGFVDDVIVDTKCAKIVSLVIFGRSSFLGFIGKCEDYIIPWEKIELIGEDTIIISCSMPNPVKRCKKPRFKEKF